MICMESVCERAVSVCGLHARRPMMVCMDIVSVLIALVTFAGLYALIFGIDRI
jgi:hypothetical protein